MERAFERTLLLGLATALTACTTPIGNMRDQPQSGGSAGVPNAPEGGGGDDGGSTGGAAGAPNATCTDLETQYASALLKARSCDVLTGDPQCTLLVDSRLECPCVTWANPDQSAALADLSTLRVQWAGIGCGGGVCTQSCAPPGSGTCTPAGTCDVAE